MGQEMLLPVEKNHLPRSISNRLRDTLTPGLQNSCAVKCITKDEMPLSMEKNHYWSQYPLGSTQVILLILFVSSTPSPD